MFPSAWLVFSSKPNPTDITVTDLLCHDDDDNNGRYLRSSQPV